MYDEKKKKKSLWEQMGRDTAQPAQEQVKENPDTPEEKPERFKMIKGIVRGGGLGSVFKKKA